MQELWKRVFDGDESLSIPVHPVGGGPGAGLALLVDFLDLSVLEVISCAPVALDRRRLFFRNGLTLVLFFFVFLIFFVLSSCICCSWAFNPNPSLWFRCRCIPSRCRCAYIGGVLGSSTRSRRRRLVLWFVAHSRFGCLGVRHLPALLFDFLLQLSVLLGRSLDRLARLAAARVLLLNFLTLLVHHLLQFLLDRSDIIGYFLLDRLRLFCRPGLVSLLFLGHEGVDRRVLGLLDLSVLLRRFLLRRDLYFGRCRSRLLPLGGMSTLR